MTLKSELPTHWQRIARLGQQGEGRFAHTLSQLKQQFICYRGDLDSRPDKIKVSPQGFSFLVYQPDHPEDERPILYCPGNLLNQIDLLHWHPSLAKKIAQQVNRAVWILQVPEHFRAGHYFESIQSLKRTLDWLSHQYDHWYFWGDSSGAGLLAGLIQDNAWPFQRGCLFYPLLDARFLGVRDSERQYVDMFFHNQALGARIQWSSFNQDQLTRHPNVSPLFHSAPFPRSVKTLLVNAQFDYCFDGVQSYQDKHQLADYQIWPVVHAFWAWHQKMKPLNDYLTQACSYLKGAPRGTV